MARDVLTYHYPAVHLGPVRAMWLRRPPRLRFEVDTRDDNIERSAYALLFDNLYLGIRLRRR